MVTRNIKRVRVVLSLENKLTILDRLAQGEMMTKLAKEYNVGNYSHRSEKERSRVFGTTMESLSVCLPKRMKDNVSC